MEMISGGNDFIIKLEFYIAKRNIDRYQHILSFCTIIFYNIHIYLFLLLSPLRASRDRRREIPTLSFLRRNLISRHACKRGEAPLLRAVKGIRAGWINVRGRSRLRSLNWHTPSRSGLVYSRPTNYSTGFVLTESVFCVPWRATICRQKY